MQHIVRMFWEFRFQYVSMFGCLGVVYGCLGVVLPFISADNWKMSEPTQRPTKTTPPPISISSPYKNSFGNMFFQQNIFLRKQWLLDLFAIFYKNSFGNMLFQQNIFVRKQWLLDLFAIFLVSKGRINFFVRESVFAVNLQFLVCIQFLYKCNFWYSHIFWISTSPSSKFDMMVVVRMVWFSWVQQSLFKAIQLTGKLIDTALSSRLQFGQKQE